MPGKPFIKSKSAAKPGKAAAPGKPFVKTGSTKPGGNAKNFSKGKGKR